MPHKRVLIASVVLLIVAANAIVIYWRMSTRDAIDSVSRRDPVFSPAMELERQRQRLSWEEHPVISLGSPALLEHVKTIRFHECVPVPEHGVGVGVNALTHEQRTLLDEAISSFLAAYYAPECSPHSVLGLMKSLDMVLDPQRIKVDREYLIKSGAYAAREAAQLSDEDVFLANWGPGSISPSMSSCAALSVLSGILWSFESSYGSFEFSMCARGQEEPL